MTYMFLLIALGLIDAVSITTWQVLAALSVLMLGITYLLESSVLLKREASQTVTYTNLALVRPDERHHLIADLEFRLGVTITHLSIKEIDFEKQHALIYICYVYHEKEKTAEESKQNTPRVINGNSKNHAYATLERSRPLKEYMPQEMAHRKAKGRKWDKDMEYNNEDLFESRDKKTVKKHNGYLSMPRDLNL